MPTTDGWISCKDKLPEPYIYVIVADDGDNVSWDRWDPPQELLPIRDPKDAQKHWHFFTNVTHWMPFPDAPQKEKETKDD